MIVNPQAERLNDRIARLRMLAQAEPRLEGVLLYGSWTMGEADAYSDIEAYLYVNDDDAADFDGRAFVEQLAPVKLAYINMYGLLAVVFDDLMRGEFHVEAAGKGIPEIASWRGLVHLPEPGAAILLDRHGRLAKATACLTQPCQPEPVQTAQQIGNELTNWTLALGQILARGEIARGHALLHTVIAPQQLQLCRLLRGTTAHWLTPSRALEADLPLEDRLRYAATTARLRDEEVRQAAKASWDWSRELIGQAVQRWRIVVPESLHDAITELLDKKESQ
ncbi:MAG TPA: nucleotidyltransferase domain-containing protein [Phycisphaerae bacterium]|jgi:lincosamide nucleotidyltransferase|nr:nucleotidyltransferase domain-containing protein [Phycisphaerae bacterium]HOB76115.1 nucleotidyltransferase domain-containing protein [Phycisphaerae bacterium]HOJ56028.1 nucleotidyltransferase domain-containing protein [Phycisphaerae bacterium]HOL27103.1 nucleotidyltransferase domain-containing protein [Phycisphaerae bacterium]HPP21236.1 nucleotidyltransferase domain-containing protein [Phycisphaerae bacterium]